MKLALCPDFIEWKAIYLFSGNGIVFFRKKYGVARTKYGVQYSTEETVSNKRRMEVEGSFYVFLIMYVIVVSSVAICDQCKQQNFTVLYPLTTQEVL